MINEYMCIMYMDTGIQGQRDARIQEYRDNGTQGYRNTWKHGYRNYVTVIHG